MPKTIVYNDDGWSSYMRHPAPMSPRDIIDATVTPLVGTGANIYQFCALGGHAVNYSSAFLPHIGEMLDDVDTMHVWRMRETLRHLKSLDTDPLRIVSDACHNHGIACQYSLRMNDRHHTYKWSDGRWYFPELISQWIIDNRHLQLPDGALDYAHDEVHDYRLRQVGEVLDRYDVDGIDLDFTRFKPWFRPGNEDDDRPRMTSLMRRMREVVNGAGKTLSARFEYAPDACAASGLDVETWLKEGLLDQITLGGVGDHTPDARCDWWVQRAAPTGCKVYPGIEGQLHWIPSCGSGGTGLHAGSGVDDGFGPPSMAYVRAVAALHYMSGADGLSLFNFTCADGPFSRDLFTEPADPANFELKDKQYVAAVWPGDIAIFQFDNWQSRFAVAPAQAEASYTLRVADDLAQARRHGVHVSAALTLELQGVNRFSDIEVRINGAPLTWDGFHYNHFDHGCWNDIVRFIVLADDLKRGDNRITVRRTIEPYKDFTAAIEVRKCVLDLRYHDFETGRQRP